MNQRRRDLLKWAVENLDKWPKYPEHVLIDTSEIGASFRFPYGDHNQLPNLYCNLGGGFIHSLDWFYARKKKTKNQQVAQ